MAASIQQTIPKPSYPGPHDFLLFIVISVIVCAICNLTSIGFGIPALVLALLVSVVCTTVQSVIHTCTYYSFLLHYITQSDIAIHLLCNLFQRLG